MGEVLGQAVLELRTDDSGLVSGIGRAKVEAEGLQSSFNKVSTGVGASLSSTGAAASQMAAQAQASGRAAVGMAEGFQASATAARLNTVAMRETLVVARELSRGNFTRIPGSLTLLAANTTGGLSGFTSSLTQSLGLVRTLQNAELAEEATNAAAGAAAVRTAAQVAAAKVLAADAQLALAAAAVRTAEGADAEAAAQARLATAHEAVAAAAAEATIAEDALATAEGAANEAAAAASASAVTGVTALGAAVGGVAIAAGLALAGFEGFKSEVKDSGALDQFAEGLRLTKSQIEAAGGSVKYLSHNVEEVTGLTITWGDVAKGTFQAVADAAGISASQFHSFWREAFLETAQVGVSAAQVISGAFAAAHSIANDIKIPALAAGAAITGNPLAAYRLLSGMNTPNPVKVGQDALNAFKKQFSATGNFFHQTLPNAITQAAHSRLQSLSDRNNPPKPPRPKKPRKERRNAADDELAKLDAEIQGENALASAFLTSDAAAVKAQADQKALTLAVEKHATAAQTAALKEKELALAIATGSAEGAKHVADLSFEADSRKMVNDLVAAGIIPEALANRQLALEAELRPLLALKTLAHGAALATLNEIIQATIKAQSDLNAELSREQAFKDEAANNDEIDRLRLEASLIGASNRERAVALAQLEAEQRLKSMPGLSAAEQQQFIQSFVDKANAGVLTPFQQFAQGIPQTAQAIGEAIENDAVKGINDFNDGLANAIVNGQSLFAVLHAGAAAFLVDLIKLAEQEAEMAIFKAIIGGAGAAAGGFGTGSFAGAGGGLDFGTDFSTVPFSGGHALGGLIPSGTFGIVGEKGPEPIIATSRGAMVLPNSSLRHGVAANDRGSVFAPVFNNDFRGADANAVSAIEARLDRFQEELPGQVVSTMQNARTRFIWRG